MRLTQFLKGTWPLIVAAFLLFSFGAYTLGLKNGHYYESVAASAQQKAESERDRLIMAVIVKKNPNATIKDFSDFPRFLVEECERQGLDYRYVMALIDKESEWNPRAVSPVGAVGLMQLMPETALLVVGKMPSATDYQHPRPGKASPRYETLGSLADPQWNVRIGVTYLKWKINEFGLGPEHLRAYNRGDVQARAHWAGDRYAEDVALKFVALSMQVPR